MAENSISKKEVKNLLLEILAEDQALPEKIFSAMVLKKEIVDFFHAINLAVLKSFFKSKEIGKLESLINKDQYKYLLNQNSSFLKENFYFQSDQPTPKARKERIDDLVKKHRIKQEAFEDLQELFKDEPPAEELIKLLSK